MVGAVRPDYFQGHLEWECNSFFKYHVSVKVSNANGFGFSVHGLFFYRQSVSHAVNTVVEIPEILSHTVK